VRSIRPPAKAGLRRFFRNWQILLQKSALLMMSFGQFI
jgi:hypothetical protein